MNKGNIAGDSWKIPFVGPFFDSIKPSFDKYYTKWQSGDLSCVSVFHKFVVIAATRDMARKVFNSPTYVKPCVVDAAHKLLRPENWVFLDGKEHVEYRKGLNGLFTRQALECYLPGQQEVYREYFAKFLQMTKESNGEPRPVMYELRELMCAVSCRTFVGHYCSKEQVKTIADDYYRITEAMELVNFPVVLPYTKVWYGKKAADKVLEIFANCAAKARVRMRQKGAEPECIMDRWLIQMQESDRYRERIAKGETVPQEEKPEKVLRNFSDMEISMTIFTFLFASQDATSSACSWMLQLMADRPDCMAKVLEEAKRIRPDPSREVKLEDLEQMQYTRAVVKETLRYRPPVLMVPYIVKKDFHIPEANYTAPKGAMIVPSTWMALHDPEAYVSVNLVHKRTEHY
jgi:sterol 22-desaturase